MKIITPRCAIINKSNAIVAYLRILRISEVDTVVEHKLHLEQMEYRIQNGRVGCNDLLADDDIPEHVLK